MKILYVLTIFLLTFTISCNTSSGLNTNKNSIEENAQYNSLADRLRTIGGVQVMGTGENISVIVRGIQSFGADPNPIYVINGLNVGRNYQAANQAIPNINQVKSIRVLKSKSETAIYGEQGNNGVILIKLN